MNRRDFLHPRRLGKAAADVLEVVREVQSLQVDLNALGPDMTLVHYSRRAMAATFEVIVPFGTPHALPAADAALDEVDRLEDQMTVYRDTSEVSALNRRAASEAVAVEPRLFDLFTLADGLHRDTEGAFDITTGALTRAWGFYRRQGRVPDAAEREAVRRRVGMRHVVLNAEARTLRFLKEGLEINLGSIGKGYALDRAAAVLRDGWGVRHALLHGGKSSIYAVGSEPGHTRGWPVALRHPWEPDRQLAVLRVRDRGLGTSAATFQNLEHEGRKLGHVLDPRTGWPAKGIASATAVAATAAEADALATAFFVLGVEKARAYCAAHPGVGAVLLPEGEGAAPVVLNLSAEEVALCTGNGRPGPQQ